MLSVWAVVSSSPEPGRGLRGVAWDRHRDRCSVWRHLGLSFY